MLLETYLRRQRQSSKLSKESMQCMQSPEQDIKEHLEEILNAKEMVKTVTMVAEWLYSVTEWQRKVNCIVDRNFRPKISEMFLKQNYPE